MLDTIALTLLLAVPFSLLGLFVVLRNESFAAVGLSHAAFGGAGLALLLSLPAFPTAVAYTVAMALLLHHFSESSNRDAVIGVAFAFSMALGILSIYLSNSYTDAFSLLFGSLLAVKGQALLLLSTVFVVAGWLLLRWKELYYVSFDPEFCKARGCPVERLERELLAILALAIVVGMKVVGALLIASFLIIPPTAALLLRKSLLPTALLTALLTAVASAGGVTLSYLLDTPPGATIVFLLSLFFLILYGVKSWKGMP